MKEIGIMSFGVRSVQITTNTRWVSLPIAWCRSNHLENGSGLDEVLTSDGFLLLKPAKKENRFNE